MADNEKKTGNFVVGSIFKEAEQEVSKAKREAAKEKVMLLMERANNAKRIYENYLREMEDLRQELRDEFGE